LRIVLRSFNRGGNYNNTANGFASFNGNNDRSNANGNIGFRAASPASISGHDAGSLRASFPRRAGKGIWVLGRDRPEIFRKKNYECRQLLTLRVRRSRGG